MTQSIQPLIDRIIAFGSTSVENLLQRYFSQDFVPGFILGNPVQTRTMADVLQALDNCHAVGVDVLAGRPTIDWIRHCLRHMPGKEVDTFGSYRTAELLVRFGTFADNELLREFSQAERDNVLAALDSTNIWDAANADLLNPGQPVNYHIVMARCEWGRQQLGVLEDDTIFQQSLAKTNEVFFAKDLPFLDDSRDLCHRYDIYTFGSLLLSDVLWEHFDSAQVTRCVDAHVHAFDHLVMRGGYGVTWGRSTGLLSLCMSLDYAAFALKSATDAKAQARYLAIIDDAFTTITTEWFDDGFVCSHRHRSAYPYRGPHRILQMSFDCLAKVLAVAKILQGLPDTVQSALDQNPYPDQDVWVPFDAHSAGVWCYRQGAMEFQLPAVGSADWGRADYAAWPRRPGVFEAVIDSCRVAGLPKFLIQNTEYFCGNIPAAIEKKPDALVLTWKHIERMVHGVVGNAPPEKVPAEIHLTYRAEAGRLILSMTCDLDEAPQAISLMVPQTSTPVTVQIDQGPEHFSSVLPTDGMKDYHTFWNEVQAVHEVHFAPAPSFACTCSIILDNTAIELN